MSGLAEGSVQTEREVGRDAEPDSSKLATSELAADVANIGMQEMKTHDYKHYLHLVITHDGRGKLEKEENRYLRAFQHLDKMFFAVSKNSAVMVFSKPALALRFFTIQNAQQASGNMFLRHQDLAFKIAYTMDAALEAYIDICLHEHVPKPAMPTFGFSFSTQNQPLNQALNQAGPAMPNFGFGLNQPLNQALNQAGPAMPNFGFSFPTQNQGPNQAPNQVFTFAAK